MTTMADLTPGTRVRHIEWQVTGTVCKRDWASGPVITYDAPLGDEEIGFGVHPEDVEIIGETS